MSRGVDAPIQENGVGEQKQNISDHKNCCVKIIVATHKQYQMPSDPMYLPLFVGAVKNRITEDTISESEINYQRDDTGENISYLNSSFCELTGLYWAWKNLKADYIGLVHYRRHFSVLLHGNVQARILTREQLEKILECTDVILPHKRNYYIETIYNHYAHTLDGSHLDKTRDIIKQKCPDYLTSFDHVMYSRSAHMFNMFIMRREILDQYCEWLFGILFELRKDIDTNEMSAFESRLFGRISELLLDVWINKNHIPYKEIYYVHMEPVNWNKKIGGFLSAKFLGKKYTRSW